MSLILVNHKMNSVDTKSTGNIFRDNDNFLSMTLNSWSCIKASWYDIYQVPLEHLITAWVVIINFGLRYLKGLINISILGEAIIFSWRQTGCVIKLHNGSCTLLVWDEAAMILIRTLRQNLSGVKVAGYICCKCWHWHWCLPSQSW